MKKNIEKIIEKKINELSNRIINDLLEIYKLKIEVNKPFCTIVLETIPNDYKFCELKILARVSKLIPRHLYVCPNNKYIFVEKIEDINLEDDEVEINVDSIIKKILLKIDRQIDDREIISIMNDNLTSSQIRKLGYTNYVKVAIELLEKIKEKNI